MDTYNVRCLLDKLCAHNVAGHNWNAHCTTADDKWKAPQFWVCVCVHQWNAWYSFSIIHIHIYIFFSSIIHAITWPDMPWFACSARRLSAHATIYFVFVVVKIRAATHATQAHVMLLLESRGDLPKWMQKTKRTTTKTAEGGTTRHTLLSYTRRMCAMRWMCVSHQ